MNKTIIRYPVDEIVSVDQAYYDLPMEKILPDRNGRKRPQRTQLVSHNGRHTICRDIGLVLGNPYWGRLPVEKVICTDFVNTIYLRKIDKRIPLVAEICNALKLLGYPDGEKVNVWRGEYTPDDIIIVQVEGKNVGRYDMTKHTFVD